MIYFGGSIASTCFQTMYVSPYILIQDPTDYLGRSFLHAPQDVGVNLRSEEPPDKCFLPKKLLHTWEGHTKGTRTARF